MTPLYQVLIAPFEDSHNFYIEADSVYVEHGVTHMKLDGVVVFLAASGSCIVRRITAPSLNNTDYRLEVGI